VVDQFGSPVAGASVVLSRADAPEGPFEPVADGSSVMSSRNRANPVVTDVSGRFSWDVVPGWYKVTARAAGAADAASEAMEVPPERVGLVLAVDIAGRAAPRPVAAPQIRGTAAPGQALTLGLGTWAQELAVDSVSWTLDGAEFAAGASATLPADSGGKTLAAVLTAHQVVAGNRDGIAPVGGAAMERFAFRPFDYAVPGVAVAGGQAPGGLRDLARTPVPAVVGAVRVGSRVVAAAGAWDAGVALAYQWTVDGAPIPGATGPAYTVPAAAKGRVLAVKVGGVKAGHKPVVKASAGHRVGAGKLAKAPKPVVKGKARVGQTLKAKAGKWDAGVAKTYRWYAGGKKIKGAVKAKYKIAKKHQGKRITVKVTGKKPGYTTVTKTSKKTAKTRAA
jgi:hypothetical protein